MDEWVTIAAPATISNIGPGFDIFGMALQNPYDTIMGRKIEKGLVITEITGVKADGTEESVLELEGDYAYFTVAEDGKQGMIKINLKYGEG